MKIILPKQSEYVGWDNIGRGFFTAMRADYLVLALYYRVDDFLLVFQDTCESILIVKNPQQLRFKNITYRSDVSIEVK